MDNNNELKLEDFREWLKSLPPDKTFEGARYCRCPIAQWLRSKFGDDVSVVYCTYRVAHRSIQENSKWMRDS